MLSALDRRDDKPSESSITSGKRCAREVGCDLALSARLRGEREWTRRVSDGEGEVGAASLRNFGTRFSHLTATLSALQGRRGGILGAVSTAVSCVNTVVHYREGEDR